MIHIQKITLRNFKSFRKADIPLSIGFTAIVGSNGSGKSNILDAFLFVFGINSLKALRASRMTDLVNNQAKDDYAKVEVTLEDDVTKKEYIISRTIDTAGKSVMRLNDKRVTLNEVASLLEELGIKPFGHNIVVQGDVTRIIEMNAVQRREMIDEVAGIREFDEKKEEAHKELGNVEQKIKEVRIVISERSTQLEQLAADRQAALRHNELQEELKKTKATLFRAEVARLSDELSKNAEKKARLEDERQKKESRLSESRTELREAEAQIEQANAELVAASEKTFSEVGIRIEEKKSERRVGQERMANRRQGMEAVDSRIKTLRERLEKIAHELVAKGKLFDQKNVQAKDLEERIRQKQSQLENARTAVTGKARELKSLEDAVLEAEETATEVTRAYFEHNSALDTTRRTLEMRRGHLNEVQSELSQAQARLEGLLEKQRTLQELLSRHPKPTEQHHQLLHKIEDAVRSISYAESGLDSAKKSIQALEKSAANCPVCETKLSAKQKTDVLSAKKSEEHRNALTVKEATELRNRLLEEKKTLETVMAKQAELERFLSPLAEVQAKADQLRQRVAALVSGLDESKTRELETRMQEAKKRMEDAQDDV
jgi:chromosome segregation protein